MDTFLMGGGTKKGAGLTRWSVALEGLVHQVIIPVTSLYDSVGLFAVGVMRKVNPPRLGKVCRFYVINILFSNLLWFLANYCSDRLFC